MRLRLVMWLAQGHIASYGLVPRYYTPSLMIWATGMKEGLKEEVRPELAP